MRRCPSFRLFSSLLSSQNLMTARKINGNLAEILFSPHNRIMQCKFPKNKLYCGNVAETLGNLTVKAFLQVGLGAFL